MTILMENLCQGLPKNLLNGKAEDDDRDPLVYTEAEMKAALEEAYKKGNSEGQTEGRSLGAAQEQEKLRAEIDALESVADGILMERSRILVSSGRDMTQLALEVASRILRRTLTDDSKVVFRALEDVLTRISEAQRLIIRLNPTEMDVVENQASDLSKLMSKDCQMEFRADPSVSPGGCIVDTPELHIDASTDSFWQRLEETLNAWCANEMLDVSEPADLKTEGDNSDAA